MRKFLSILSYAKNYKREVLLSFTANFFFVVFNLLSLLLFIPFLDILFSETQNVVAVQPAFAWSKEYFTEMFSYKMGQRIADGGPMAALTFICWITVLLFFLKNLFRYLSGVFMSHIRQGIGRDIRKKLYEKVTSLPLSFFSDERKGDIMARNTADVIEVDASIIGSLGMMFRDPLNILLSFATMLMISPQMTLFSLILLPISGVVIGRISKSLKRTSRKGQDKQGELLSYLEESLGGLKIIKAFNAEGAMRQGYEKLNESLRKISIRLLNKRDLASPTSEFLGALVMVGVVWYGGRLILSSDAASLSGSEFIGFIILFSQSLRPIQSISKTISTVNKGMASVDRINAIIHAENDIKDPVNPKEIHGFHQNVRYENVHFSYEEQPVLKGLSFTLEKGKTIALVGESGGGKSTLADLLPRFYDPQQGAISIDGVDLKEARVKDIRDLMGVVSQQAILFNDSIRNNITFGHEASDESVQRAAKIAHAHDFIMALPHGYDTRIGDAGGKLSGGQRQRISIARAVLKNPPILILDEATSALDTESEKLVQDALEHLMKDRTTLVIAHRLSTIQHADEILVIQQGAISERGTHSELLAKDGLYKKLREMQS